MNIPNRYAGTLPTSDAVQLLQLIPEVRFIESLGSLSDVALTDRVTQAAEQGRKAAINALLAAFIEGAQSLDVFTAGGTPYVGITFVDGAIPLAAEGDGVQQLVRQSIELAALPGGLALVEEPEAHKHLPRSELQPRRLSHRSSEAFKSCCRPTASNSSTN